MALRIEMLGQGECGVTSVEAGVEVLTSKPARYGGLGRSFSSTDLLAAALGTCVASDIEPIALRHGVPLEEIEIVAEKELRTAPKRLDALRLLVTLPAQVTDDVVERLRRASETCVVRRSLASEVEVVVSFKRSDRGA